MKRMHLTWALLCVGCGDGSFSAAEREAESDGGLGDKPAVRVTGDDAGSVEGSGGGSGDAAVGSPEDGAAGSGGSDAGGTPGMSGGAGGSTPACTTGAVRCSGLQPEVCASGDWFASGAACSGATPVCLNGRCVECNPGTEECLNPNQPGICDASGFFVASGPDCAAATPQCLDNTCVACDPDNVRAAGYCGDCGVAIICCMGTFGVGCGCATFDGCK